MGAGPGSREPSVEGAVEVVDNRAALPLAGHLDGRCSAELRVALYDHIEHQSGGDVVVDLSEVESIDMTALRLLATAALRLERTGRRLVLRGCSPSLRRVVAFGGWRRLFVMERPPGA